MKLKIIERILCIVSASYFLLKGFTVGIVMLILIEAVITKKAK